MHDATAALPPACVRTLRAAGAREHRYAETHRNAGRSQDSRHCMARTDRLSLLAAQADARAADLAMEAR